MPNPNRNRSARCTESLIRSRSSCHPNSDWSSRTLRSKRTARPLDCRSTCPWCSARRRRNPVCRCTGSQSDWRSIDRRCSECPGRNRSTHGIRARRSSSSPNRTAPWEAAAVPTCRQRLQGKVRLVTSRAWSFAGSDKSEITRTEGRRQDPSPQINASE